MSEFDKQFSSDEEALKDFDALVDMLREARVSAGDQISILNPIREKQIEFVYKVLKFLTKGTDAVVTYKLHEPENSFGSVSAEAKSLELYGSLWFTRIMEFANNFEVYPLKNGKVRLSFAFYDLTIPIEEVG